MARLVLQSMASPGQLSMMEVRVFCLESHACLLKTTYYLVFLETFRTTSLPSSRIYYAGATIHLRLCDLSAYEISTEAFGTAYYYFLWQLGAPVSGKAQLIVAQLRLVEI